jgi:hypothetical protein
LREQGGTEDKKSLGGQCYDFDIFTGKIWKKFGKNWKFFKKRLTGVGSEPGSSRFHLFSHFHHFTAEPQRLPI